MTYIVVVNILEINKLNNLSLDITIQSKIREH